MLESMGLNPHKNDLIYVEDNRPQSTLKFPDLCLSQSSSIHKEIPWFKLELISLNPQKNVLIFVEVNQPQST